VVGQSRCGISARDYGLGALTGSDPPPRSAGPTAGTKHSVSGACWGLRRSNNTPGLLEYLRRRCGPGLLALRGVARLLRHPALPLPFCWIILPERAALYRLSGAALPSHNASFFSAGTCAPLGCFALRSSAPCRLPWLKQPFACGVRRRGNMPLGSHAGRTFGCKVAICFTCAPPPAHLPYLPLRCTFLAQHIRRSKNSLEPAVSCLRCQRLGKTLQNSLPTR